MVTLENNIDVVTLENKIDVVTLENKIDVVTLENIDVVTLEDDAMPVTLTNVMFYGNCHEGDINDIQNILQMKLTELLQLLTRHSASWPFLKVFLVFQKDQRIAYIWKKIKLVT